MLNLKNFMKADHEKAVQLNDHYERFISMAKFEMHKGDFEKAELYCTHATTMIHELRRLNNHKKMFDQASELLDQIKQQELINQWKR